MICSFPISVTVVSSETKLPRTTWPRVIFGFVVAIPTVVAAATAIVASLLEITSLKVLPTLNSDVDPVDINSLLNSWS